MLEHRKMPSKIMKRAPKDLGGGLFPTHPTAVNYLLDFESFPKHILEPACGDGAISKILEGRGHRVDSSDLYDHGYGEIGVNFLTDRFPRYPAIVTNPPFYNGGTEAFARRALQLATKKVAIFCRLVWISGSAKRHALLRELEVSRILVCGRVPMGPKQKGLVDYCWLIWDRLERYDGTRIFWADR